MIVDVAFYLKLGFGRQRHGFESGSWFWGDMGLSPHLCFLGDVGLSPHLCFLGVGRVFFNLVLFGWWWWFYFDFLGD